MILKKLAIAAVFLTLALAPAAFAGQAGIPSSSTHQAKPSAGVPSTAAPGASGPSAPGAAPNQSNPAPRTDCPGGNCDTQLPHITIATPAPAPAPWPMQERIAWAANLILVLIAYVGITLALSALRKIERQTRYGEAAAQAAAESAKAALLLAQAQERAERPWILVAPENVPGTPDSFHVVAVNRGKSPARIASLSDGLAFITDEAKLSTAAVFKGGEPAAFTAAMILLPGESTIIKSFRRDEVKSICESPEHLLRVEEWQEKIYLLGTVTYADLRPAEETQTHETTWCCWYIHGRQKSGLVMAGPPEFNKHT
ncbi:MAG: hypothetical protein ABSB50_12320 [Terracidiphilus sp.]|jgi:hypothetical protein